MGGHAPLFPPGSAHLYIMQIYVLVIMPFPYHFYFIQTLEFVGYWKARGLGVGHGCTKYKMHLIPILNSDFAFVDRKGKLYSKFYTGKLNDTQCYLTLNERIRGTRGTGAGHYANVYGKIM